MQSIRISKGKCKCLYTDLYTGGRQLGTHTKLNALSTILANVHAHSYTCSLVPTPNAPPNLLPFPTMSPPSHCAAKPVLPPGPLPHSPQAHTHPSPGALHLFWPLHITHTPSGPRKLVWAQKCAPPWSVGPHFSACSSICLYFPTPYIEH